MKAVREQISRCCEALQRVAMPFSLKEDGVNVCRPLYRLRRVALVLLLAVCPLYSVAATYYLSASGSDGKNGLTSGAAWLTPNHSVNCGDTIIALPSNSYVNSNLQAWGQVTCPGQNNVAWLKCATFDGCKVAVTNASVDSAGIMISNSFWGVSGFEVDDTATSGFALSCFGTSPGSATLHHIIFANNIANTCPLAAFGGGSAGSRGTDYLIIVGNIAYGGGVTNYTCGSNIDVFSPVASDNAPGTHIFVAGNFSFGSGNPDIGSCFDGNGIIFDTFDGHTTPGLSPYTAQAVIKNNFALANGGSGILVEYNSPLDYASSPPAGAGQSAVYVLNNTMWGNSTGIGPGGNYAWGGSNCGEFREYIIENIHAAGNLAVTDAPQCFGWPFTVNYAYEKPNYVLVANLTDSTSVVAGNWAYSPYGLSEETIYTAGFTFGINLTGTDPQLAAPAAPPAPSCAGYADVPHCMAAVVANFSPQNSAAQVYGYQSPSTTNIYDPLFPQWLCNANLPSGLVTMGCSTTAITKSMGTTRMGALAR